MSKTKVFITHNTGATNKGVEKMLHVVIDRLSFLGVAESDIVAVSNSVSYDSKIWQNVEFIYRANFPRRIWFLLPIWNYSIISVLFALLGKTKEYTQCLKVINAMNECDVLISIGGDMFSDDYNNLPSELAYVKLAKRFGKKVLLLGHTIGKFKTTESLNLAKAILPLSDKIVVRDNGSFNYLQEVGMDMTSVVKKTDLAFSFNRDVNSDLPQNWKSYADTNRFIGFNISHGYAKYMSMDYDDYISLLADIVADILDWYDGNVLLIPHVFDFASNDDSKACDDLCKLVDSNRVDSLSLIDTECSYKSAADFKKLISLSEIFVSVRMHSAIAALSRAVPTYLFSYSLKAKSLLRLFFEDVDKYSAELSAVNLNNVKSGIRSLYEGKESIRMALKDELVLIKKESKDAVDYIDKFVR